MTVTVAFGKSNACLPRLHKNAVAGDVFGVRTHHFWAFMRNGFGDRHVAEREFRDRAQVKGVGDAGLG